jgi:hypothetical protein
MRIEPSGIVMISECEIQTPFCTALTPSPVTAVWGSPGRRQINVCRRCLEEMVRLGEWENPGAHISRHYDIAVYDKDENIQLVVEVKKTPYDVATNLEDWATRIRRNLIVHSGIPNHIYFLLAIYPAPFYLWEREAGPEKLPSYCFDVQNHLIRFQEGAYAPEHKRQENIVSSWLLTIVNSTAKPTGQDNQQAWLHDSGLFQAIQGGKLVRQRDRSETKELQPA